MYTMQEINMQIASQTTGSNPWKNRFGPCGSPNIQLLLLRSGTLMAFVPIKCFLHLTLHKAFLFNKKDVLRHSSKIRIHSSTSGKQTKHRNQLMYFYIFCSKGGAIQVERLFKIVQPLARYVVLMHIIWIITNQLMCSMLCKINQDDIACQVKIKNC